jgi:hypothetical protein
MRKGSIMHIPKKFMLLTLFFAILTSSIQAQTPAQTPVQEESYDEAYMESYHSAHWSIYIPIAAYAAAAIFLGFADTKHSEHNAHSRSGALGPMENYGGNYSSYGTSHTSYSSH